MIARPPKGYPEVVDRWDCLVDQLGDAVVPKVGKDGIEQLNHHRRRQGVVGDDPPIGQATVAVEGLPRSAGWGDSNKSLGVADQK
jgi:hypothetical protein